MVPENHGNTLTHVRALPIGNYEGQVLHMLVFKQKYLHQTALATVIVCAVTAVTALPAHAETNTDDVLTTSEVSSALDQAGTLVQEALSSVTTATEAAVSTAGDVTVEVPKDLNAGVDVSRPVPVRSTPASKLFDLRHSRFVDMHYLDVEVVIW